MESYQQIINIIALTMGVAWASGINLYAALLTLGVLGATGNMSLPPDLQILAHPAVMAASGFMFLVEFLADKAPGVDTGWDAIHTFIRSPGGALLAAGALGDVNPALSLAAAIIGGGIAAGSHLTKAGSRVLINASPEPFTNWAASLAEDAAAVAGIWVALHHPWLFLALLTGFVLLAVWLLPKIWRGIQNLFRTLAGFFSGGSRVDEVGAPPTRPALPGRSAE